MLKEKSLYTMVFKLEDSDGSAVTDLADMPIASLRSKTTGTSSIASLKLKWQTDATSTRTGDAVTRTSQGTKSTITYRDWTDTTWKLATTKGDTITDNTNTQAQVSVLLTEDNATTDKTPKAARVLHQEGNWHFQVVLDDGSGKVFNSKPIEVMVGKKLE